MVCGSSANLRSVLHSIQVYSNLGGEKLGNFPCEAQVWQKLSESHRVRRSCSMTLILVATKRPSWDSRALAAETSAYPSHVGQFTQSFIIDPWEHARWIFHVEMTLTSSEIRRTPCLFNQLLAQRVSFANFCISKGLLYLSLFSSSSFHPSISR